MLPKSTRNVTKRVLGRVAMGHTVQGLTILRVHLSMDAQDCSKHSLILLTLSLSLSLSL